MRLGRALPPREINRGRRDGGFAVATLIALTIGLGICLQPHWFPDAELRSRRAAAMAVAQRRGDALTVALEHYRRFPSDICGIALAAEAAAMQSEHDLSMRLFRNLPRDGSRWEFQAEFGLGTRLVALGRIDAAEQHLQRAVAINPLDLTANARLAHVLQVAGRVWESAPHFFVQILQGKCRGDELLGMSVTDRFFRFDERLHRTGLTLTPPDSLIQLADARRALMENRTADAERLLRTIVATRPDLGEAQGRLGRIVVDRGDLAEFLQWRGG